MAQWSRSDKTLYAKVVYYGPAFGGKTTNLESLHRLTDPGGKNKLLTIQTSDDRTLFFDLLPFDLGDILGYQVALKLYTVPGQVRFDTTRQVVLSGADAIIFVADSSQGREEQNRWSLQNLKMNMRARRLDPARVPVIFQYNKQDLGDAAAPDDVARSLGVPPGKGLPSVATEGKGVLETFMVACRAMLEALIAQADERTRREIDAGELTRHLERTFSPHLARQSAAGAGGPRTAGEGGPETHSIVGATDDLLQSSVETSAKLGEKLSAEFARAGRLEREAEAYRRLSEALRSVGASFDRGAIIDSALVAVTEILDTPVISLIRRGGEGPPAAERVLGRADDPLSASAEGKRLLERMLEAGRPSVVDDLAAECGKDTAARDIATLRAAVAVPVKEDPASAMLVYAAQPDGGFNGDDVRFLDTVAGHLSAGLEKARLHAELAGSRDRLEEVVDSRTKQLRQAYDELCTQEQTKDRFLSNLSHEMKTPLTAVLSSAVFLRDYKSNAKQRAEMLDSIIRSAEVLHGLLENLFRVVSLEGEPPLRYSRTTAENLARESVLLAGDTAVKLDIQKVPDSLQIDVDRMARALANLVDNARKFGPQGGAVKLRMRGTEKGIAIAVLDRGPGVSAEDRERIFSPFEQGGDPLTAKPSGIGIGLYEARTIARQHGGTIAYRPRKGGGSEFRIEIPSRPQAERPAKEAVGA